MKLIGTGMICFFAFLTLWGCGDKVELVEVTTEDGFFFIEFYADKAPGHVENFKKNVKEGLYDGLVFHRVIEGFMAQGGDPSVSGKGSVEYTIPAEISPDLKHVRGAVAAARKGDAVNPKRESSGTQFYICYAQAPWLDGKYTIFGHVDEEGMKIVDKIRKGDKRQGGRLDAESATRILKMKLVYR